MDVKLVVENVGPNHTRMELEETCELGALKSLLNEVADVIDEFAKSPSAAGNARVGGQAAEEEFVPPSEGAMKALWGACMRNGTDIETVCREYGYDSNHISKYECWRMTHDLNERSGYGQGE